MELTIRHFSELTLEEFYAVARLREAVFVVEQNCPYPELDGKDQNAYHVWLHDEDGIAAYLRVLDRGVSFPDAASIGRVLSVRRRQGLGTQILKIGMETAREKFGAKRIRIEAQTYARGLYESCGFRQCSAPFLEDGIEHIEMIWEE